MFERALDLRRSLLGDDHPDTLESAANVVGALWGLGQYERARRLGEDTLTCCRRALSDDHPDTLRSVHRLAVVLASLGEHDQARRREETGAGVGEELAIGAGDDR
ncbi:MAG TPA: tetratricopeptide repeat protein [Pseudonocardiaceae bacterium]|nr:tetratricopeptide repeat protein [Pseudonocardiaceae bacterium]